MPSKRSCVEPMLVSRYGNPTRSRRSSNVLFLGLKWIESPSGSKPVSTPADESHCPRLSGAFVQWAVLGSNQ
jgi:hypothetical protein